MGHFSYILNMSSPLGHLQARTAENGEFIEKSKIKKNSGKDFLGRRNTVRSNWEETLGLKWTPLRMSIEYSLVYMNLGTSHLNKGFIIENTKEFFGRSQFLFKITRCVVAKIPRLTSEIYP